MKRLKREIIDEMVKDNIQEECPVLKFEESVGEEIKGALNENQVQISENIEETLIVDINQEEGKITLEQNQVSTSIQEEIMDFSVPEKMKVDNVQSSNEKSNEELVMAGFKGEVVQLSTVKYQGKSFCNAWRSRNELET